MPFSIHITQNGRDRDAAYRLRGCTNSHAIDSFNGVLLDVEPNHDRTTLPIDFFDAFPTTTLIVAQVAAHCVATVRVSVSSTVGSPMAGVDLGEQDCLIDAIAVATEYQDRSSLFINLLKMAIRVSDRSNGIPGGAIYISAPSWSISRLEKMGFTFDIRTHSENTHLLVIPRAELKSSFTEPENNHIVHFTTGQHRIIYQQGEAIFRREDEAFGLFVVARGSVRLEGTAPDGSRVEIARLGPGDILGEEVCTGVGSKRWVDAIADSGETDLYYLDSATLSQHMRKDPDLSEDLRRLLGERIQHMTAQLLGTERPESIQRMITILWAQSEQVIAAGVRPPFELPACTPSWLATQSAASEASAVFLIQLLSPALELASGRVWVHDPEALQKAQIKPGIYNNNRDDLQNYVVNKRSLLMQA